MKKAIKGYEGKYEISEEGDVYSLTRLRKNKSNSKARLMGRKLKPQITKGYLTVALCKKGKIKRITIHKLIYIAFIGTFIKGKQINHKDGNKLNNRKDNLELVTPLENTRHSWKIGLSTKKYGENMKTSKLTLSNVELIRHLYENSDYSQKNLADLFRVHKTTIHYIISGKTWPLDKIYETN